MATVGETTRPGYVYDSATDVWIPVGIGPHSHTPAAIGAISSSVVTTKGDLIVATGSGTVVRQGVGADGSYLVADSTQADGLNWAGPSTMAGRNGVINGGMDVWQRGTSFASQSSLVAAYTADRMHFYRGGGATGATLTRQNSGLTGIQYCARLQRDSGNTNTGVVALRYTMETTDSLRFAGQVATLSFYVRAGASLISSGVSNLTTNFVYGTGTDQPVYSFTGFTQITGSATNSSISTSWQRISITGTVNSAATEIGIETYFAPVGTAGASDYVEITGLQVEIGSVATPFARNGATYQAELAACQRYYIRQGGDTAFQTVAWAQASSTTVAVATMTLPVQMRVKPTSVEFSTLRVTNLATGFPISAVILDVNFNSSYQPTINTTHTSATVAGNFYYVTANNSTAGYLAFSAEL